MTIADDIIALETGALDRWCAGDPDAFLALSAGDVTYFDPFREKRLDGHDALTRLYDGLRGQIDALKGFFGKPVAGSRLGVPVPQDWVDGAKTLQSAGLISGKLAATDYYVTGLVAPERFDALVGK